VSQSVTTVKVVLVWGVCATCKNFGTKACQLRSNKVIFIAGGRRAGASWPPHYSLFTQRWDSKWSSEDSPELKPETRATMVFTGLCSKGLSKKKHKLWSFSFQLDWWPFGVPSVWKRLVVRAGQRDWIWPRLSGHGVTTGWRRLQSLHSSLSRRPQGLRSLAHGNWWLMLWRRRLLDRSATDLSCQCFPKWSLMLILV